MLKSKHLPFLLFFLLIFSVSTAFSGVVERTYYFSEPVSETRGDYDVVMSDNAILMGEPGAPLLPLQTAQILLPPAEEVESVELITGERVVLSGVYDLEPAQEQFKLSATREEVYWTEENPAIYSLDANYPQEILNHYETQFLCGHGIGIVNFNPIQYNPVSGKVSYFPSITVRFNTTASVKSMESYNRFLRRNESVDTRLGNLVDNPEDIMMYGSARTERDEDDVDYLIIARYTIVDELQDFINFKIQQGYRVDVRLGQTNDILGLYDGRDNQEKIRNCVIDYYENHNLQYLLLVGEGGDLIGAPCRYLHGSNQGETTEIPADMYYACLDGDWDTNGNNTFGEAGEYDVYYEVMVGRAPTGSAYYVSTWGQKQIAYQKHPKVDEVETALMVGEDLDWSVWGKDYKEEVRTGGSFNGYITEGFPSNFDVQTLYDKDRIPYGDPEWDPFDDLLYRLNGEGGTGYHMINHLGHGLETYSMKLNSNDIDEDNITNDGLNHTLNIMFSQACLAGAFDQSCIYGRWAYISTGAVCWVCNSREGWGSTGSTNGASHRFDREFWDAIWGEDIFIISEMVADCKEDNAGMFSQQMYRWCGYEINLFGDPSIDVWSATPEVMVVDMPSVAVPGQTSIDIHAEQENGTYLVNARIGCSITVNDTTQLLGYAMTDGYGNASIEFARPLEEGDVLDVIVSKHNFVPHVVELPASFVASFEGHVTDEGTGDALPATVINDNFGILTSADETGFYQLFVPEAGEYVIRANYLGYEDYVSAAISVEEGENLTHDVTLSVLPTAGTIEGHVTTSTGAAIVNAEIRLLGQAVASQFTDETGFYQFQPVTPGEFQVQAIAEGYDPMNAGGILTDNGVLTIDFVTSYTEKFEDTDGRYDGSGEWEWGTSEIDGGPEFARSGINLWGTDLDNNYNQNSNASLYTQPYILDLTSTPSLNFFTWYQTKEDWDGGNVKISTDMGGSWDLIEPIGGYPGTIVALTNEAGFCGESNGWIPVQFDLSEYVNETVMFRFQFATTIFTDKGWFIDDVAVNGASMYYALPANLMSSVTEHDVMLTWDAPQTELAIQGYNVYRHVIGEGTFDTPIAELDASTFEFGETMADGNYVYGITTLYEDLESTPSAVEVRVNVGVEDGAQIQVPVNYQLDQNYPNPFNPTTSIAFQTPDNGKVSLRVYDISGKLIKTLVNDELDAGYHDVVWNGTDDNGADVSSGVYLYKLEGSTFSDVKRMLLVK